jgi:hypothetical protein
MIIIFHAGNQTVIEKRHIFVWNWLKLVASYYLAAYVGTDRIQLTNMMMFLSPDVVKLTEAK